MNRGTGRRRLRLRRKRKDESFGSKLSDAGDVAEAGGSAGSIGADLATEVVFQSGCCLLEAVVSAFVLFALIGGPAYLLLHRVT